MKRTIIFVVLIICLVVSIILFWIKVGSQEIVDGKDNVDLKSNIGEIDGDKKPDTEEITQDKVAMIKDGKIYNEEIIDNFLESEKVDGMELNIIYEGKNVSLKYIAPTEPQSSENGYDIGDGTGETKKKIFGYYILDREGEEKAEFTDIEHKLVKVVKDDKVIICFDAPLIEYISNDYLEVCKYDLSSSNLYE